ncbi:response regulator [Sphingobium aromaticiconvertens]|uniref:response regulator transcription factor n=1 Tax=Sphingobium aromaticiconvertens TaxID=365341 RepID=UPI00301A8F30
MQFFKRNTDRPVGEGKDGDADTAGRRLRLLVVDENQTARTVIARRLSHLNHDVALAENGFVALNILITRPVDIILIDMGLILLPALATMKRIRESGLAPACAIVMITSRTDSASAVEALKAGADDHIVKPFDFDLLDARLRHVATRAEAVGAFSRQYAELDARVARRAMELGETREALTEMQRDRARLVSSIQALHDEIERLNAARA